ncbi:MAG: hypothetical protein Q9159_000500 [Coniocarpon cinnabarinum]
MAENRRTSGRLRKERDLDEIDKLTTQSPKSPDRPKKIRKIHARGKAPGLQTPIRKDAVRRPGTADSSSAQASPAPFGGKVTKDSPLPTAPVGNQFLEIGLQSVASSGVLAASIARSRTQWVSGGIFERYWVKPRRSKGQVIEPPNNPTKDTMTNALGKVRVTIEPHTMDAVIYGIRDPPLPNNTPSGATKTGKPVGRPPNVKPSSPAMTIGQPRPAQNSLVNGQPPYGVLQSAAYPMGTAQNVNNTITPYPGQTQYRPPPAQPLPTSPGATQAQGQGNPGATSISAQASSQPPAQASSHSLAQPASQTPTSQQPPAVNPQASAQSAPTQQSSTPAIAQQPTPAPTPQPGATNQPLRPPANQDPVIQALARRAQESPTLKALMKIVAAGQANKEQLAEFQKHIDELSVQIRSQQANAAQAPASRPGLGPAPSAQTNAPAPLGGQQPPRPYNLAGPLGTTPTQPAYRPPYTAQTPSYVPPKPAQPRLPPPPEKYKALAIEFLNPTAACNSTPNDRLLFPKHAIISRFPDYPERLHASLLAVRTNPSTGKKMNEPVNIVLEQIEGRPGLLGIIERSAATLVEAQKHVHEVVRTTERAGDVELVMRTQGGKDESRGSLTGRPNSPVEGGRRGRKKEEDLSGLCSLCYSDAGGERDDEGNRMCKSCKTLRGKARRAKFGEKVVVERRAREVMAGATLCWG